MITEDYVSFEVAKLLKEKGFYGECLNMYLTPKPHCGMGNPNKAKLAPHGRNSCYYEGYLYQCEAPTLQMACKWLREVHKLVITVSIGNENNKGNTDYSNPDRWFYFFDITNTKGVVIDVEYDPLSNEFPTYEEAVEVALKYVLENLI